MTEQEKRDKIIKKLAILRTWVAVNPKYGKGLSFEDCVDALPWLDEAIEALKQQGPRLIRFDEINNYEVLWLEVRDVKTEDGLAPWIKTASGRWFSPLFCSETRPDMILSEPHEYDRICRCWTSRPTDEQREAEPWN